MGLRQSQIIRPLVIKEKQDYIEADNVELEITLKRAKYFERKNNLNKLLAEALENTK